MHSKRTIFLIFILFSSALVTAQEPKNDTSKQYDNVITLQAFDGDLASDPSDGPWSIKAEKDSSPRVQRIPAYHPQDKEYAYWHFSPRGQLRARKINQCLTSLNGAGVSISMTPCNDMDAQRFKYHLDTHQFESIAFPGLCITSSGGQSIFASIIDRIRGFYHISLMSCEKNNPPPLQKWRVFSEADVRENVPNTGGEFKKNLDVLTLPPLITVGNHQFEVQSGYIATIKDYRYAQFVVPNTYTFPMDCQKLQDNAHFGKQIYAGCIVSTIRTCRDYENSLESEFKLKDAHYPQTLFDIKEWWDNQEHFLPEANIAINAGWYDVRGRDDEGNGSPSYRQRPIPYQEACSSPLGLFIADQHNQTLTNEAFNAEGHSTGKLGALLIKTAVSDGSSHVSFTEKISVLSTQEVDQYIDHHKLKPTTHISAISGVPMMQDKKMLKIDAPAQPQKVVARTVVAMDNRSYNLYILVLQNGHINDAPKQKDGVTVHQGGIDLPSVRTYLLEKHPNITDMIALDGSGSSQMIFDSQFSANPLSVFYKHKNATLTKAGDTYKKNLRYRPIPGVLMIKAVR